MLPILHSHYSISSDWRVFNNKSQRWLKWTIASNWYKVVTIRYLNGDVVKEYIHRLVWLYYLPSKLWANQHINHKNKDKTDNRVENLEWVTQAENNKHSWIGRLQTVNQRMACIFNGRKNWKNVYQFTKEWSLLWMFRSTREAWGELWIAHQDISRCCNWIRKSAGWFVWSYIINPYL